MNIRVPSPITTWEEQTATLVQFAKEVLLENPILIDVLYEIETGYINSMNQIIELC